MYHSKTCTYLGIILILSLMTACGGATVDIKAEDNSVIHYDTDINKSITKSISFTAGHSTTSGESTQTIRDNNIQLDRLRVPINGKEEADLNFDIEQSTAGITFHTLNNKAMLINVSPEITYTRYQLDAQISNQKLSKAQGQLGLGVTAEIKYKITPKLHMGLELSDHRFSSEKRSGTMTLALDFMLAEWLSISLGYRYFRIDEPDTYSTSGTDCHLVMESINNRSDCEDSDIDLKARGLLMNISFSF